MRIARRSLGLSALALTAALAACSSSTDDAPAGGSAGDASDGGGTTALPTQDDVFPVTVPHAFGETTVPTKPERIVSLAWANHEVPLALGVTPVAISLTTWGDDDDNGILPWTEQKLAELGAQAPILLDDSTSVPFEQVADAAPDVILASYSGLTQEDYDTLTKIAPVIAYPEVAWGTSLEDMITLNSAAIGLAGSGLALIEDLRAQVQAALEAHAALDGKKILFAYLDAADLSQVGFYTTHDPRAGFLQGVGLPLPSIVEEESAGTTEFYVTVSSEEAQRFEDVDVLVTYGDDPAMLQTLQADPLLSKIPAIAAAAVAILPTGPLAASANPTPLSIPWGIGDYFDALAGAVR
ncbi:ABC transporter substrate-binding protein [Brachybacterium hainanense]|uniref:ABC transporter substrate-binding protein n=1 Tax=Brachybacterium hainanense TaxID=1541174 RepID=A0ABV6RCN5_9MICO